MYKLTLIFKYLRKRRIAWVALIAVMLCTTMVLVVISVMGGWLTMFKNSFHGLSGDVLVRSDSLAGFAYYQDMIERIKQVPSVEAAVPTIQTYGLINIGNITTEGVQVLGLPADKIGSVNRFPDSLYLQHQAIAAQLNDPAANLSPQERDHLQKQLQAPPSFGLLDESFVFRDALPWGLKVGSESGTIAGLPADLATRFRYDPVRHRLVFKGIMSDGDKSQLQSLSSDAGYRDDINALEKLSHRPDLLHYKAFLPRSKADVTQWPGMIPGAGIVGIHRNEKGEWEGRDPILYRIPVKLTVLGINGGEIDLQQAKAERVYWIVDDSRTQIWQYDNKMVYVPFDVLQKDLGMEERTGTDSVTGEKVTLPARATEIDIRVQPGADLNAVKKDVVAVVHKILEEKRGGAYFGPDPKVETWLESQAIWINAIENEKLLTVVLFGIISIVAIFLIFCIFYMIVVEKTRDIGIIKSVGATGQGVAGIFLGYGATIGVVGSLLGLLTSYLIVHYINELHAALGRMLHVQIWNPEVYLFDKIPNTMNPRDVIVIVGIAIVASVLGALIPAIRAARLNPVEALRWE